MSPRVRDRAAGDRVEAFQQLRLKTVEPLVHGVDSDRVHRVTPLAIGRENLA
ncbi:MAG: hypothetical protein JW751_29390 [Polyangiaceae bacterium]|nr:hypothetical protein [Polyangiaceae bacterium]